MKTEITEEQQVEFESLIESGAKLEAIRYAQQNFGLDAEQAITMVERLEEKLFDDIGVELEKSAVQVPNIVGGVFSVIGIILIGLAAYFGYRSYDFLQRATTVPAVVKEFKERPVKNTQDNTISNVFAPVLQYHYEGKDYTWESPYGSSIPAYAVGDQVQLLVDPAEPGKPEEDGFMNNWFVPMLLGAIGFIFGGVGIIVVRAFRKP